MNGSPSHIPPRLRLWIAAALPLGAALVLLLVSQFGPTPRPVAPHLPANGAVTPQLPVLLIPGWLDEGDRLWPLRDALHSAGWDPSRVRVMEFEDPVGSNVDHARELARAIDDLLARTGAPQIDLVAHSMGGLAARLYLQEGGDARVRRVVFLASPHRGSWASLIAWGEGGEEMHPESDFLATLEPGLPDGVEGFTIRTEYDTHVIPNESSTLPGVEDLQLCCPSHAALPGNPEAMEAVIDFLTRADTDA